MKKSNDYLPFPISKLLSIKFCKLTTRDLPCFIRKTDSLDKCYRQFIFHSLGNSTHVCLKPCEFNRKLNMRGLPNFSLEICPSYA